MFDGEADVMVSGQLHLPGERRPSAVFSDCTVHRECHESCPGRKYRFLLRWPTGLDSDTICTFVLANPSTASAEATDPTVSRCIKYAARWGFGWCYVVNVRAWRSTDPKLVPVGDESIGATNDEWIGVICARSNLVVCGWGLLGADRADEVLSIIRGAGKVPHALKLTNGGHPQHPLYLKKTAVPIAMESADGESLLPCSQEDQRA